MKFLQALTLTAILTCASLAQAQTWDAVADFDTVTCGNLLVNGSFEASGPSKGWYGTKAYDATSIPGWVVEAGSVDYGNYCPAYWESTNGIKNIDLNGAGPGTLSQTFATVPGQVYELSFRMGANNYCGVPTPTMRVSAGDTVENYTFDRGVWNGTPLTASQWAHYGFVFTATGATTKLTFQSLSPSCGGPTLDSVWVDFAGCGGGWEETTNCFLPVVDSDGDGFPDNQDICPGFDDAVDTDADGTPDGCDACPNDFYGDSDGDGLCDSDDPCYNDPANDADNDGLCANDDICPLDAENDADGDGACGDVDTCPYDAANDADGDGICGNLDACPGGDDNADDDGDGAADFCDVCPFDAANDADNDGLCAEEDICPLDADNDIDEDEICGDVDPCAIDVENDADGDGICESDDNCPTVANANQSNVDGDTFGDACEPDNDDDGVVDDYDNCPLDVNPDQADFDGDTFGDVCDLDADGDGVIDGDDVCLGTTVGEPVLINGCSVAQECVCEAAWKNHGAYVSCVAHASTALLKAGLISEEEKGLLCSTAGQSSCGAKKK